MSIVDYLKNLETNIVDTSDFQRNLFLNTGSNSQREFGTNPIKNFNSNMTNFIHNNMVPNATKFTQNMAGTGVQSGNYIHGVTINSGYGNETPFKSTLNLQTGTSDTFTHRREIGPMFNSIEEQTGYAPGDMKSYTEVFDRFKSGTYRDKRNDLRPVEPIQVGPGLNLDPSIPSRGTIHDTTRFLPNNVNDYRANQLPGRVNMGKLHSAGLPTSMPVVQNNAAPRYFTQERRPIMPTKAYVNRTSMVPDYEVDKRPNNAQRDQISYGYASGCSPNYIGIAPVAQNKSEPVRYFDNYDNNVRIKKDCNVIPFGNPSNAHRGTMVNNYYVTDTDRGQINVYASNVRGSQQRIQTYNQAELPKTTTRETTNANIYVSAPAAGNRGHIDYSYEDVPKTTMKETNSVSYVPNPARETFGNIEDRWLDAPKTTTRETSTVSYVPNPSRETRGTNEYRFVDKPRTKQDIIYSHTNPAGRYISAETSRTQFTGSRKKNFVDLGTIKEDLDGMNTITNRSLTSETNYMPGRGRVNIRQNPDEILGSVRETIDSVMDGPSTLTRAIPNITRMQNNYFMPEPSMNPNKLFAEDNRQISDYLVENLKSNPLSMYSSNPDGEVPSFLTESTIDNCDIGDLKIEEPSGPLSLNAEILYGNGPNPLL